MLKTNPDTSRTVLNYFARPCDLQ